MSAHNLITVEALQRILDAIDENSAPKWGVSSDECRANDAESTLYECACIARAALAAASAGA